MYSAVFVSGMWVRVRFTERSRERERERARERSGTMGSRRADQDDDY